MGCSPWGHKESGTTERLTLTKVRPVCLSVFLTTTQLHSTGWGYSEGRLSQGLNFAGKIRTKEEACKKRS